MKLPAIIEAILFYKGEPVSILDLSKIVEKSEDEIRIALTELEIDLTDRGVRLVMSGVEVSLGTNPELSSLIEKIETKNREYEEPSKAALETLSVILYRGPLAKAEIDYLRGVNCYFTLRHLLSRGLVSKIPDQNSSGGYLYQSTPELLSHLGVGKDKELPNYSILNETLK